MRKADDVETLTWHGHEVTVETWFEQCSDPYDGEGAPPYEGVDLLVEVTLCPDDAHTFKAYGSLGGVYGDRTYVRECVHDLVQEALDGLQTELEAVAAGRDVLTAHARQALAMRLLETGPETRARRVAQLEAAVGYDPDLGVVVDHADPNATTEELADIVREARADAAVEREREKGVV